jgi:hypothetical protein
MDDSEPLKRRVGSSSTISPSPAGTGPFFRLGAVAAAAVGAAPL